VMYIRYDQVSRHVTAHISFADSTQISITSTSAFALGVYRHIAFVRNGTTYTLYIDGVSEGSATSSSVPKAANLVTAQGIYIAGTNFSGDGLEGYIDELRFTNGIARYTANFTPPAAAFGGFPLPGFNAGVAFRMGIWQALAAPHIKR